MACDHFQPDPDEAAYEKRPIPTPIVFTDKEHSFVVFEARNRMNQKITHEKDKALTDVHEHVGALGDDRRLNGTDKPPELSPFGDVVDDDDEDEGGLDGWSLADELEEFRARRQIDQHREAAA